METRSHCHQTNSGNLSREESRPVSRWPAAPAGFYEDTSRLSTELASSMTLDDHAHTAISENHRYGRVRLTSSGGMPHVR